MTNRRALRVALLALVAPCLAQAEPPQMMGDGAQALSPSTNRLGSAGASGKSRTGSALDLTYGNLKNYQQNTDGRTEPIKYKRWKRNTDGSFVIPLTEEEVTIGFAEGTSPPLVQPSAAEWLAFMRDRIPKTNDLDYNGVVDDPASPPKRLSSDPPRQTVLVIDQGERKRRMVAGLPPEVPQSRLCTVVTRWTEAVPRYENRTIVAYPCCCNVTFSFLVGYDYIPHVETTTRYETVADFPMTTIAVDRGIIVSGGSPQYTTNIPQLCQFHYGPNATLDLPVVPLIANKNDTPDLSRNQQDVTITAADTTVAKQTFSNFTTDSSYYAQQVANYNQLILFDGSRAGNKGDTIGTVNDSTTGTVPGTQTTITEPMTKPLIPGTAPALSNFGGVQLSDGEKSRLVDVAANDQGVIVHSGDKAVVTATTISRPDGSTDPYAYMPVRR